MSHVYLCEECIWLKLMFEKDRWPYLCVDKNQSRDSGPNNGQSNRDMIIPGGVCCVINRWKSRREAGGSCLYSPDFTTVLSRWAECNEPNIFCGTSLGAHNTDTHSNGYIVSTVHLFWTRASASLLVFAMTVFMYSAGININPECYADYL